MFGGVKAGRHRRGMCAIDQVKAVDRRVVLLQGASQALGGGILHQNQGAAPKTSAHLTGSKDAGRGQTAFDQGIHFVAGDGIVVPKARVRGAQELA